MNYLLDIFCEGYDAFKEGQPIENNPYEHVCYEYGLAWHAGWLEAAHEVNDYGSERINRNIEHDGCPRIEKGHI